MKRILFVVTFAFMATLAQSQLPLLPQDISPLLNGETVPDATLSGADGTNYQLHSLVKEKPTVLLFYRGGWCPYCNRHLSEIQGVEGEVGQLGYQIVAISPDSPENLKTTHDEKGVKYRLFSDANGDLIRSMGIAFKAPGKYLDMLNKKSGGYNQDGFLPVPAVFVVDEKGTILFEYINPDYKTRLSGGLLLAVLKELSKEK